MGWSGVGRTGPWGRRLEDFTGHLLISLPWLVINRKDQDVFQNIYLASVHEFKLGISREITSGKIFSWPRKSHKAQSWVCSTGTGKCCSNECLSVGAG